MSFNVCDICSDKLFSTSDMTTYTINNNKFYCPVCDKIFHTTKKEEATQPTTSSYVKYIPFSWVWYK